MYMAGGVHDHSTYGKRMQPQRHDLQGFGVSSRVGGDGGT